MNYIANNKLYLNGKVYKIVSANTPEDHEQNDRPHYAALLRKSGVTLDMVVLKGKTYYSVNMYAVNVFSTIAKLF